MPGLSDWFEIFSAGDHVDSGGRAVSVAAADLDRLAASYDPAAHEAPLVVGHPATDAPAWGWVAGLKSQGGRLYARASQVAPEFEEMVSAGRFKKRSAAFYRSGRPDGGLSLRHVGFLGAQPPAVKGLKDISFSDGEGESFTVEFSDGLSHHSAPATFETGATETGMNEEELKKKLAEERAAREAAEEKAKAAEAKAATLSAEFAEKEKAAKRAELSRAVDRLAEAGAIPEDSKPVALAFAEALAGCGQREEANRGEAFAFSESGPDSPYSKKQSMADHFLAFLERLTPQFGRSGADDSLFSEQATKSKCGQTAAKTWPAGNLAAKA